MISSIEPRVENSRDADEQPVKVKTSIDWPPLLLMPILALVCLLLIGAVDTWLMLTVNGLAMGMIIFIIASGLTLIFGLMDVFNFGHGAFIAIGAYIAYTVLGYFSDWVAADDLARNLAVVAAATLAAVLITGILGWVFERVLIRKVYGQPLTQILITMGGMIVCEELIKAVWDAKLKTFLLPTTLRGSIMLAGAAIEKYRIFAVVIGLIVFVGMMLVLNRTKLGLLIRAGVQDREMVECFGYPVKSLFVGVFVGGSALAGLGGVMWVLYQQLLYPQMGSSVNILIFIVIMIGGLGSIGGSFLGAMLVSLLANYIVFLSPKVALVSNILLMVVIFVWRPHGLYKVTSR